MKPATNFVKSSTPVSTVSSTLTSNAVNLPATAVQSGPYTKAQFQNTMEGSRSIKNVKEIEQLLRDYPAALELYRTGRYKVKIKNEADIERVILVEKRTNKNQLTKTNDNQSIQDVNTKTKGDIKKESNTETSHSRTHSQDRAVQPLPSVPKTDSHNLVQTTASSMHTSSYSQPKVEQNRTSSKERDTSLTSLSKHEHKEKSPQRSQSREDSRSKASHSKHKGKKNHREHTRALVPYVPNGNAGAQTWHRSRALQPYFSNPIIPQQQPISNMYMPTPYGHQQNPMYPQPYYYGQTSFPALVYQKPSNHPLASTAKSGRNHTNPTLYPSQNYASSSSNTAYTSTYGPNAPPSYHPFQTNQQQYPLAPSMYPSQIPYQMPVGWPTMTNPPGGSTMNNNNQGGSRKGSKHRARSVDTGARAQPPANYYNQPQPAAPVVTEYHHHHHRHHHHRSQPPAQTQNPTTTTGTYADVGKVQNVPLKDPVPSAPPSTVISNTATTGEKLTIRQLNEIFTQMDPSGRLQYSSLPTILQRFGISLGDNDLMSAAQSLGYNTTEPISARRLVHVLVKLGKITKSAQAQPQQQQRQNLSPTVLPEDREVNEILTQRRATGAASTHIHSSVYPNRWY